MATYAPVSSVVVSGADRNYDGIPDALQGSRRILTNGDVSPRRIVERDLSPNRTITRVISPTYAPTSSSFVAGDPREPLLVSNGAVERYPVVVAPPVVKQMPLEPGPSAPKGAGLTAQQKRWLLWIIVGFLLAAMVALVALLWPSQQLVMEKIVSVKLCPKYESQCPNVLLPHYTAKVGDYCTSACKLWHGNVDMRWCPTGVDHSGDAGTPWGWCSETQDGKKLCPLQTALAFLQEQPAWTDIECSGECSGEMNADYPKGACASEQVKEKVVSVEKCPFYESPCPNVEFQKGAEVGDSCIIACQHWHGKDKWLRWCPTGPDHSGLANTAWGWCSEAQA